MLPEKLVVAEVVKNFVSFMEFNILLPFSLESAIVSRPEPCDNTEALSV